MQPMREWWVASDGPDVICVQNFEAEAGRQAGRIEDFPVLS